MPQIRYPQCTTKVASLIYPKLPNAQFHAYNCSLCLGEQHILSFFQLMICRRFSYFLYPLFLQISCRLFELTNTLKSVFIPTKNDRQLLYNFLAGAASFACLYFIAFMVVQIPQLSVSPSMPLYNFTCILAQTCSININNFCSCTQYCGVICYWLLLYILKHKEVYIHSG